LAFKQLLHWEFIILLKAKTSNFMFGQTTLNDDAFHGTGKEMFKGFIK
jgi:hypothetical protein